MKKSKTVRPGRIRGTVSIAAIETSPRKSGSLGVPESRRAGGQRKHTLNHVLHDLQTLTKTLGHFPSRLEYKAAYSSYHSRIVRLQGLRHLAAMLGYTITKSGPRPKHSPQTNEVCLNRLDCISVDPPAPVLTKQTYCLGCKRERGWYD